MSDLSGGDVLITGASGVIGQAVARRLIRDGFRLHLSVRNPDKLSTLRAELQNTGTECLFDTTDLRNVPQAEQVVRKFFANSKRAFGLVCVAGHFGMPGPFAETDWADWEETLRTNFLSHAAMIHSFVGGFARRRLSGGSIVTFSGAGLGGNASFQNISSYSTAKAGLTHLVEAIAPELVSLDIIINAVAPGAVFSNLTEQAIQAESKAPELAAGARKVKESGGVPAGLAAEMVAFLLGPKARAITGRLLSARFDQEALQRDTAEIAADPNRYRLRRIDNELFVAKPK